MRDRSLRAAALSLLLVLLIAVGVPSHAVAASSTPDALIVSLQIGQKWAGRGLQAVELDAAPFLSAGRTLVPVRFLAESLGYDVGWEPSSRTVTLTGPATAIIRIGQADWTFNGELRRFDVAPAVYNDRTYLPLRAVAEAIGAEVAWDDESQTVIVSRLGREPTLRDLEQFAAQLVNIERARTGRRQLAWDETAAAAGRVHATDMAAGGFFSHWNRSGDLPIERYNRQGGTDAVAENLATWYWRDPPPGFYEGADWSRIIRHHDGLMRSAGHRENTLAPAHTHVGVGLAETGNGSTYLAVEFVDRYGAHTALPTSVAVGDEVTIQGQLHEGVNLYGITVSRRVPTSMSLPELERTGSYSAPWPPYAQYYPPGYITPVPININGNRYSLTVPLSDNDETGLYYVYVWATVPGSHEPLMISMQTVTVK